MGISDWRKSRRRFVRIKTLSMRARFSMQANALPNVRSAEEDDGMVQTIEPVPDELICGDVEKWAREAPVKLTQVRARWWRKGGDDLELVGQDARWTALHFHGGSYVFGSALRKKDGFSRIPSGLVEYNVVARVLSVDYTLLSSLQKRIVSFPLQLLEGLSAYYFLVHNLNISPSRIIITGDSAGGHLALSLMRYILESKVIAPPAGVVLLSPWCDTRDLRNPQTKELLRDLPPELVQSPYFSACLHAPLPSWPPTFISSATNEKFATPITALQKKLNEAGVPVDWCQTEGIGAQFCHDFLIHDLVAKMWPEKVDELWQRVGKWTAQLASMRV